MEREEMVTTPGFRFYPTEEELITFYLKHKIEGGASRLQQSIDRVIPQLHVYHFHPSVLPQYAGERCQGDTEQWFFFIPRQEKEARGGKPSRLTSSGYWKATGSLSVVYSSSNRAIGIKRTMVYYNGRAPTGTKTKWKMNEYKAFQDDRMAKVMEEFSLCRIYVKSNSLRSFDRRPPRVMIHEQRVQNNEHHATTSTNGNHPLMFESSMSLSDRSHESSDDQTVNYHYHPTIESGDQPLWNFEELELWF